MWIEINTNDIQEGESGYNTDPISVALKRILGIDVIVTRDYIRFIKKLKIKDRVGLIPLPKTAQVKYLSFKKGMVIHPWGFELPAIDIKKLKDSERK